ncbi:MAG: GNAT family N-acetyltransferase [Planctomycetia bacterium]|nr:GNAT family N-acetyltransferase [Planctomycetia bacterium]
MRRSDRSPQRSAGRAATRSVEGGTAGHSAGQLVRAVKAAKKAKKARSKAVATIEIRPAGTVVSRRPMKSRVAVRHLPEHPVLPLTPPSWMLEECHVAPARAGDQSEILQLLSGLATAPTKAEFHAAVDHPDHDAANRLVARLAGRIVGHIEVMPRRVLVDGLPISAAAIDRVAILPECRGAGHGQRLVQSAEERMRHIGAWVGLSRTRIAPSFQELGWAVLGRDCATPGRPTEILARLLEGPQRVGEPVTMRQWRHVELPAILRIYRQNAARFVGPLDRNETYSRWLVSRGAFDSIIVALMGQDRYDLHETTARIVGYAIQSGNRVLEIMADPEFPGVDREILARVCAEAVENDRQEIIYESSTADPLHAAVTGGEGSVQAGDRMIVAKLFRPLETLEALVPAFVRRVTEAGIRETVELGLESPDFRGSIIVSEAKGEPKATVQAGRVGRSYLRLAADELARLVLGQCDPQEAVAAGRMEPSTQVAVKLAGQLFPRTPLWCPMWDDLPA